MKDLNPLHKIGLRLAANSRKPTNNVNRACLVLSTQQKPRSKWFSLVQQCHLGHSFFLSHYLLSCGLLTAKWLHHLQPSVLLSQQEERRYRAHCSKQPGGKRRTRSLPWALLPTFSLLRLVSLHGLSDSHSIVLPYSRSFSPVPEFDRGSTPRATSCLPHAHSIPAGPALARCCCPVTNLFATLPLSPLWGLSTPTPSGLHPSAQTHHLPGRL